MEKVKASHVTSGAATQSDVFTTDLWCKSIWAKEAMEEDPMCESKSQFHDDDLWVCECIEGLSVCLSATS